jgi:biopolymer transport protein TolR
MGAKLGGSGGAMSEINVTPMVDVMLVLLIIFMVTAPFIQQGVEVDLPQTKSPALDVNENKTVLTLTRDKTILLGEVEIPYKQLRDKIVGNLKLRTDKEIFLHADRSLDYGYVVDVMAVMKEAGVENLGMVTDPLKPQP